MIYGVGSLCVSFRPVRYRKDQKCVVIVFCTLINLDGYSVILIIIAVGP